MFSRADIFDQNQKRILFSSNKMSAMSATSGILKIENKKIYIGYSWEKNIPKRSGTNSELLFLFVTWDVSHNFLHDHDSRDDSYSLNLSTQKFASIFDLTRQK